MSKKICTSLWENGMLREERHTPVRAQAEKCDAVLRPRGVLGEVGAVVLVDAALERQLVEAPGADLRGHAGKDGWGHQQGRWGWGGEMGWDGVLTRREEGERRVHGEPYIDAQVVVFYTGRVCRQIEHGEWMAPHPTRESSEACRRWWATARRRWPAPPQTFWRPQSPSPPRDSACPTEGSLDGAAGCGPCNQRRP